MSESIDVKTRRPEISVYRYIRSRSGSCFFCRSGAMKIPVKLLICIIIIFVFLWHLLTVTPSYQRIIFLFATFNAVEGKNREPSRENFLFFPSSAFYFCETNSNNSPALFFRCEPISTNSPNRNLPR